jgi:hypothetical protein
MGVIRTEDRIGIFPDPAKGVEHNGSTPLLLRV